MFISLREGVGHDLDGVSTLRSVGTAHSAAHEGDHEDKLGNPEHHVHVVVVGHGVKSTLSSQDSGARAQDRGVLAEDVGGRGDEDNELEQAGEEGAVGRDHSALLHPGSAEHEEGVEADEGEGKSVQRGDNGEAGASLLAVHITVLNQFEVGLNEIDSCLVILVEDFGRTLHVSDVLGSVFDPSFVVKIKFISDSSCWLTFGLGDETGNIIEVLIIILVPLFSAIGFTIDTRVVDCGDRDLVGELASATVAVASSIFPFVSACIEGKTTA